MLGTADTVHSRHLRMMEGAPEAGWLEACVVHYVFMGAALSLGEPLTHMCASILGAGFLGSVLSF